MESQRENGLCGFVHAWLGVGCGWSNLIVLAVILASMRGGSRGKVKAAGVIMIGPIPIIFGSDKKSVKDVLPLAIALTIVVVVATVIFYWLLR